MLGMLGKIFLVIGIIVLALAIAFAIEGFTGVLVQAVSR